MLQYERCDASSLFFVGSKREDTVLGPDDTLEPLLCFVASRKRQTICEIGHVNDQGEFAVYCLGEFVKRRRPGGDHFSAGIGLQHSVLSDEIERHLVLRSRVFVEDFIELCQVASGVGAANRGDGENIIWKALITVLIQAEVSDDLPLIGFT